MSKLVMRIEKEFFLKILYDEQLPITHHKDRAEYTLFLKSAPKDNLVLRTPAAIDGLGVSSKLSLMFNYRGDAMIFDVNVMDVRDGEIVCNVPESIRKNLDRTHMRVHPPPEVQVTAAFLEERYSFPYPRLRHYAPLLGGTATLQSLKTQVEALVQNNGYSHKIVIFTKDQEFSETEEHVLAHVGKTLFLPEASKGFPQTDPHNQNKIVTEDMFYRYLLESRSIEGRASESIYLRFLQEKVNSGVVSDAWVPILFQEYTVGYIRIWSGNPKKPLIDYMIRSTRSA